MTLSAVLRQWDHWRCLCLRWLNSPMRDAQSLEQLGKTWYYVGDNDVSGGLVAAACASLRAIRWAVLLLSKWALPSWQVWRHLDVFTVSGSRVAGLMLHALSVALRTSFYRLRWPPRDRWPASSSCPKRRALGLGFNPPIRATRPDQRNWNAMMMDPTLVMLKRWRVSVFGILSFHKSFEGGIWSRSSFLRWGRHAVHTSTP